MNMESKLDKILDDITATEGVTGCIVADKQGLCLGVRGGIPTNSSGVLTAIAEQARKIEPTYKTSPIIVFENERNQCIIQSNDKLTISVFKNT